MADYLLEGFAETTTVYEGGSSWLDQEVEFTLTPASYGGLTLRITGFSDRDTLLWGVQTAGLLIENGRVAAVFGSTTGGEMTAVFTGAANAETVEAFIEGLLLHSIDYEGSRTLTLSFIGADDVAIGQATSIEVVINGVNHAPIIEVITPLSGVEEFPISLLGLTFYDSDSESFAVVLSTTQGVFLAESSGSAYVDGVGTGTLTVSGQAAEIAALISGTTILPMGDFSGDLIVDVYAASGEAANTAVLTIPIAATNDPPFDITLVAGALSVGEGASGSLVIADFDATDREGDVPQFRLLDDAGGRFAITADGRLTVRVPHLLDFEQAASHSIRVEVSDGRLATDATFVIAVADVVGETILGGAGADRLVGGAGEDLFVGGAGADRLEGGADDDELKGGAENDVLIGGGGADLLDGGVGTDLADYSSAGGGVTVNLLTGVASGADGADRLKAVENLTGSAFADILVGDAYRNTFDGGEGNDALSGGDSHDLLNGGAGADVLNGGTGHDVLTGGAGDDVLLGGVGNDVLDGNEGLDTASYADAMAGVQVTLANTGYQETVGAGLDRIRNFDHLTGSAFADQLTGDAAANMLTGGAGNDALDGGDGNDTLLGGAGDDTLAGGAGADTVSYADAAGGVQVTLATTLTQNTVSAGTDRLITVENLTGSAYADRLTGSTNHNQITAGEGADEVSGLAGNDMLYGVGGDDTLNGGEGIDKLYGGLGSDRLEGGAGADTLSGAQGADTFVFARTDGVDLVADFTAEDTLTFQAGGFGLTAGAAAQLQFGAAATGADGTFLYDAALKALFWDSDGAGAAAAERIVTFQSAVTLTVADLLFI